MQICCPGLCVPLCAALRIPALFGCSWLGVRVLSSVGFLLPQCCSWRLEPCISHMEVTHLHFTFLICLKSCFTRPQIELQAYGCSKEGGFSARLLRVGYETVCQNGGRKKYGNNFIDIRGKYCLTKDSFTQILASEEAQTSEGEKYFSSRHTFPCQRTKRGSSHC